MKYDEADGYIELVNAVMAQAADDYRAACGTFKRCADLLDDLKRQAEIPHAPAIISERIAEAEHRKNGAAANMENLERFFRGRWASTLTGGANMEYVIKKLKQECGINDIPRH